MQAPQSFTAEGHYHSLPQHVRGTRDGVSDWSELAHTGVNSPPRTSIARNEGLLTADCSHVPRQVAAGPALKWPLQEGCTSPVRILAEDLKHVPPNLVRNAVEVSQLPTAEAFAKNGGLPC